MARKGMINRGYRPVVSSSAGAFEKRGDPWSCTNRQARTEYDRDFDNENPDRDADNQRHLINQERNRQDINRQFDELSKSVSVVGRQSSIFAKPKPKPRAGQWPVAGKDFIVEDKSARRRKLLGMAHQFNREEQIPSSQTARVHEASRISCGYGCGYSHKDSRMVSRHHQAHPNACCLHRRGCQCNDCKRSRNEI